MRSLYLRIYLTVVVALALFALVSGWIVQRHLEDQRVQVEGAVRERIEAWGELLERSLPSHDASTEEQAAALREWSQRLRLPMALDDAGGRRIAASESYLRRELDGARVGGPAGSGPALRDPAPGAGPGPGGTVIDMPSGPGGPAGRSGGFGGVGGPGGLPGPAMSSRVHAIKFEDGRTLWVPRFGGGRPPPGVGGPGGNLRLPLLGPRSWPDGVGLALLLIVLFVAVAGGAYPVVRRLTRRLEALKQGVEAFGAGALHQRVAEDGKDEVAAVGTSFNRAATRIEALLRSHQSLLANASHELRSPLARLKMAVAMLEDAPAHQRDGLKKEINTDIAELDALVEEVLLASRLDAVASVDRQEPVALLALAAEEAARTGASAQGADVQVPGDERLLRRAVRNLLENAQRYGGGDVEVDVVQVAPGGRIPGHVEVRVSDRGPGVPDTYRERIFEAFFRLPGHAEREGGVGLGLSLVRQIAERHGGSVRCEARPGGGTSFVLQLPTD